MVSYVSFPPQSYPIGIALHLFPMWRSDTFRLTLDLSIKMSYNYGNVFFNIVYLSPYLFRLLWLFFLRSFNFYFFTILHTYPVLIFTIIFPHIKILWNIVVNLLAKFYLSISGLIARTESHLIQIFSISLLVPPFVSSVCWRLFLSFYRYC